VIVLDASAAVDLILNGPGAAAIASRLRSEKRAAAPHLLDAEVGQVMRRFERSGRITLGDAHAALEDLNALPISRYPHAPLLMRAFDLRHNVTLYDALYLVLAEAIGVPLLTRDAALSSIPGHRATVEIV
jgi:predicted nucleic acid-binding protein